MVGVQPNPGGPIQANKVSGPLFGAGAARRVSAGERGPDLQGRKGSSRGTGLKKGVAEALQSCPTLCNPIDGSPPGSPMGFSRQEHWSGLPFPSPMHESEN